jgi:bacterioferritin-associated ferredoxin
MKYSDKQVQSAVTETKKSMEELKEWTGSSA